MEPARPFAADADVAPAGAAAAAAHAPAAGLLGRLAPGASAVAEQMLFAGANFLLNVLLGRWLEPAAYGALAVGLAVLFLLGAMHVAMLGEPLLVFGAGRFAQRQRAYLGAVMIGHWIIAAGVLVAMAASGAIAIAVGSRELGIVLIGLALASPFVLLLWLARRACYLTGQPGRAAIAGGLYLALMVSALLVLRGRAWISLPAALLVIGACNAVAAAGLAVIVLRSARDADSALPAEGALLRGAAAAHLRYGRWSASTNLVIFLSGQALLVLASALAGLEAAGLLRAMFNFITPMHLLIAAVTTLLVPALARAADSAERARLARRALIVLLVTSAVYGLVLGLLRRPLFELVYAGQYQPAAHLVWLLAATLLFSAGADVGASLLRARERPDLVLRAYAAAAGIAVVGGTLLILAAGVTGAVVAMAAAGAAATVGLFTGVRRLAPRHPVRGTGSPASLL